MKPIYVRTRDICRDNREDSQWLLPIGKSQWWEGVRQGRYPQPVKLGPRTTVWKLEDIERIAETLPVQTGGAG
jgi:prophage regulatory protein|tara:strand:- start:1335 stop:1553 length:219 start_codon:yes stop_codon:yes gene_type:complete